MAITLADIERWDGWDVREVANALQNRAASMDDIRALTPRVVAVGI